MFFFQGNEASYALDMCSHCEYPHHSCFYFILNVFTVLLDEDRLGGQVWILKSPEAGPRRSGAWPLREGGVLSVNSPSVSQLTPMRSRGWGSGSRSWTWTTLGPSAWRSSCPYPSSSRTRWSRGSSTSSTPTETGRWTSRVSALVLRCCPWGRPWPDPLSLLSSRVHRRRLPVQRQGGQRAEAPL